MQQSLEIILTVLLIGYIYTFHGGPSNNIRPMPVPGKTDYIPPGYGGELM